MQIQKRDKSIVNFDKEKIINAINRAFIDVDGKLYETDTAKDIADEIEEELSSCDKTFSVEDIQNLVEEKLMESERKDVARSYIRYRYKREAARSYNDELISQLNEKYRATNVQNQNANVDEHSFGGRKGEADSLVAKKMALDYLVSDMARRNHLNNEIYIHDLDNYIVGCHNCLSIPFDDLLANGFNTRQSDIRPAGSINTAFQLLAVIFQLQSLQQFGGVSATHLDWTMVPYVRKSFYKHFKDGLKYCEGFKNTEKQTGELKLLKDRTPEEVLEDLDITNELSIEDNKYKEWPSAYEYAMDQTVRELNQAVEGMYHNLNTLQSRSGNQLPFTSINYGTCTLPEGRMVIKALLDGSISGVGKLHKTPIFPCGIFQYWKGVNDKPGTPNYDLYRLALESTAKRLYPNYANVDWSGNAGFDPDDPKTYFSTMGCRTANGMDINGFGQLKDGRGNICPVTIILPTLAMEANGDVDEFMSLLDQKIHEAKDMLLERFEWICAQPPESAKFMYENGTMAGYIPEEGIRSALKHGTIVIGQLGLAECLQVLIGKDHTTQEGMELAKKIEQLFKDRCAFFKQEYKLNFGVYYTPKRFGLGVA